MSMVSKPKDFEDLAKMIDAFQKPLEDVEAVIYITFK